MPWKESTIMEQKIEFICECKTGNYTIIELSRKPRGIYPRTTS